MASRIKRFANCSDIGCDTRRSFVMCCQNGLDIMRFVFAQNFFVTVCRNTETPLSFQDVYLKAMPLAHINPAVAEHPIARREHFVTTGECIGQGRFPATRTGCRENEHFCCVAFQHFAYTLTDRMKYLPKERRAMINRWHIAGLAKTFGNVRRPRYEDRILKTHFITPRMPLSVNSLQGHENKFF